ncbi:DmpA family aminopeptidase [Roseococcus pinisoli]|uniref:P1 family peptidase n=1 Tax=Roseococcus pinisoli TaxID=2835040 RepID=A0ABS5QAH2_9PROT|nr:P1 family peptidase [Roseococcus pinisoli]MBS7809583.1 P1 family peptidase [Roseococcus pinisoli]
MQRARTLHIAPGILPPGPLNAITDVAGVTVGHVTLIEGDAVRTGVTAIRPHPGNTFQDKTPAGFVSGNGYGKFAGSTQLLELGEIETPVILTNTLSVAEGMAGLVEWTLAQPGNERVLSVNAVVGETNDGVLNDIRGRHVTKQHVLDALAACAPGRVAEGCVGAGTGTQAFGWKGGIGTSSRVLPRGLGGYTLGVLVQTNYGGVLTVNGAPVGQALGQYYLKDRLDDRGGDGSMMIVLATDAPLSDRNLTRLARRTFLGIGRTGSSMSNGSGDYAVAFSTAEAVRRTPAQRRGVAAVLDLPNEQMSPLFQAASEATEEAVYNAMLQAVTMTGHGGRRLEAIPAEEVARLIRHHRLEAPR